MAVQGAVQVTLANKVEPSYGTIPSAGGAQLLRRVSSSLALTKDSFTSNEVRSDQQIADMRHGSRSVRGTIEGELSTQTYDELFEALFRGTWVAGATTAPAQWAVGLTTADAGVLTSNLTFAGAGNLLTQGFKIGDIVRLTGMTTTANNNKNLRITALTNTVMTVFPRLTPQAQQAAGWSVAVQGRKLTLGTLRRSFTIEQAMPDATVWEQFIGCRIGGANFNIPPTGIATVSFDVMGRDLNVLATPYFTAPTSETTSGVLAGITGALRMNGQEQAVVTGLQLNFSNNLNMQPVIGSPYAPDIFYGRMVLTGSVSAYIEDATFQNAFINESEIDLTAVLQSGSAVSSGFLTFNMQRVKLSGAQKTIGADGGVIAQFPFQALLQAGGSGTAFDQTTITVQRSNV